MNEWKDVNETHILIVHHNLYLLPKIPHSLEKYQDRNNQVHRKKVKGEQTIEQYGFFS